MEYRWNSSNCSWEAVFTEEEQDYAVPEDDTETGMNLNQLRMVTVFGVSSVGLFIVGAMLLSMCYKNERLLDQLPCRKREEEGPEVWVAGKRRGAKTRHGLALNPVMEPLQMVVSPLLLATLEAPCLATHKPGSPSLLSLHEDTEQGPGDARSGIHHDDVNVSQGRTRHPSSSSQFSLLHADIPLHVHRGSSTEGSLVSLDPSFGCLASPNPPPGLDSRDYFAVVYV